jgi:anaerobic selenocysteine-containing dehydrogenase
MNKAKIEIREAMSKTCRYEDYDCPTCGTRCKILFGFSGEKLETEGQCALCFSKMVVEEAGVAIITHEE